MPSATGETSTGSKYIISEQSFKGGLQQRGNALITSILQFNVSQEKCIWKKKTWSAIWSSLSHKFCTTRTCYSKYLPIIRGKKETTQRKHSKASQSWLCQCFQFVKSHQALKLSFMHLSYHLYISIKTFRVKHICGKV